MHSFHQSRGRILFEVFCALTIAASCGVAWLQTGASALLAIAAVAALHSVVHATDVGRRLQVVVTESPEIEPPAEGRDDPLARLDGVEEELVVDEEPGVVEFVEEAKPIEPEIPEVLELAESVEKAELVEPAVPQASKTRRIKAPRKGSGHRVNAPNEVKVTGPAPTEEVEAPMLPGEVAHLPLAPLFEPEPFARQQRTVFGRKAG